MPYTQPATAVDGVTKYTAARDQIMNTGIATATTLAEAALPTSTFTTTIAGYARTYPAGITMPTPTCLDRWKAARNASGTTRVDVVVIGDSTSHGQTNNGDAAASANNRPIAQYLRAAAVTAGYADGGVGVRGWNASAGMSGTDNLAHVVSSTGGLWTSGTSGFYGGLFNNSVCTTTGTATTGSTLTLTGKGRYLRISEITNVSNYATASGYATWSYNVDGGGAVTPPAPTGTGGRRARTTTIDMGGAAGATHTVVITLTTDGSFECVAAWLNPTGIAFNTLALPGQQLSARFDQTSNLIQTYPFLGLGNDTVVTDPISTTKTTAWAPALAVLNMGVNEQILGSADQATALTSMAKVRQAVGMFAEMCRNADLDGVVCIPHFAFATNARQYQGLYRSALFDTATSFGMAVADLQIPVGNARSSYNVGVHMAAAGYQAQADWLWANLLSA